MSLASTLPLDSVSELLRTSDSEISHMSLFSTLPLDSVSERTSDSEKHEHDIVHEASLCTEPLEDEEQIPLDEEPIYCSICLGMLSK